MSSSQSRRFLPSWRLSPSPVTPEQPAAISAWPPPEPTSALTASPPSQLLARSPALSRRRALSEYLAVVALVFSILVLRSPDRVLNPQLWAEDGNVYFKNAFELKAGTNLLRPHQGYIVLFPRLVAEVSLLFHAYGLVPLICNVTALLIASLAIGVLSTSLYGSILASKHLRLFLTVLAAAGGLHPGIIANQTNVQWYLGLVGLHVVVLLFRQDLSLSRGIHYVGSITVLLATLSSPQTLVFLPFTVYLLAARRPASRAARAIGWSFLTGCAAQVAWYAVTKFQQPTVLLISGETSSAVLLTLLRVFFGRYFVQNLLPADLAQYLLDHGYVFLVVLWTAGAIVALTIANLARSWLLWSGLTIASTNLLIVFLGRPEIFSESLRSNILPINTIYAGRYFYLGYVLLFLVTLSGLGQRRGRGRLYYVLLVVIAVQTASGLWSFRNVLQLQDLHWQSVARQISELRQGETLVAPINPGWEMVLTKPSR